MKLFNIAGEMHESVLRGNIKRIVTTIKIDDRNDKKLTAISKIKSVQKKIKGLK